MLSPIKKAQRRWALGMGQTGGSVHEKAPESPFCIICGASPVLYQVRRDGQPSFNVFDGYCKQHKAEAASKSRVQQIRRCVRHEAVNDLHQFKLEHLRSRHVVIIPKRRLMK